jgi:predicted nucleic acid-binding protein
MEQSLQQRPVARRSIENGGPAPVTQEISDSEVADLVGEIKIIHETFAIHPVTNQIFQRASETFPTVVGTLDAIHLATALSIREIENIDYLLTHDSQLGTVLAATGRARSVI